MGKFGFGIAQWDGAKEEARKILADRARLKKTIPYSELVSQIHAITIEAHDLRLFTMLAEISTAEDKIKQPLLSAVVVHKDGDQEPGKGFYELARSLGKVVIDDHIFWIEELNRVFDYWSKT